MKRIVTCLVLLIAVFSSILSDAQVTVQIGLGTGSTASTIPSPSSVYYRNSRLQILYKKSEINAAGITGPQILDQIQFNTTALPLYAMPNYSIRIKHYAGATLTAYDPGPFTTVYNNVNFMPTLGWNSFLFTTPFIWNDQDNILLELCWDLVVPNWNNSGTVEFTAEPQSMLYFWNDVTIACPSVPTLDNSNYRPNIKFRFTPLGPCAGAPSAGNASISSTCPTTLGLFNYTLATGISIQWQKKTTCTNWSNIPNATSAYYAVTSQGMPTQYRAYVICSNSGSSDTSNIINLASIAPCYCASNASSSLNDDISNVTVGAFSNASTCGVSAPGPGSMAGMYSNFTGGAPIRINKNTPTPFSIQALNCNTTNLTYGIAIFIDYNMNGTFETTERVAASPLTVSPMAAFTGNLTVPASAATGVTGMRVILESGTPGGSINPCNTTYTNGETEDYLVEILYAPTATGGGVYCSGDSVTLAATAQGFNPTFLWKLPNGSYDTSSVLNFPNIQASSNGYYTVYVLINTCPGFPPDTSGGTVVPLLVNPTPPKPIVAPIIVYCEGDPFDSIAVHGKNLLWYTVPTGGIPSASPPVINTTQFGTFTYYVSQTITNCESPRSAVTISVAPKPAPPIVESPVGYCQGDEASPLSALGQNIRWYSVPSGGVGTPVVPTPTTNAQGTFTWYVSQTVAGCESDRIPVVVNVSYVPNALILASKPYVCQYDTMTLTYFGNALTTANFLWTLPKGATIEDGAGRGPLSIRFDSAGIQRVRLTVDNDGCKGPEAFLDVPVRLAPVFTLDLQDEACQGEVVNIAVKHSTTGIDVYDWKGFAGGEVIYGSPTAGPYGIKWNTPGLKVLDVKATDETCNSLPFFDTILIHELPDASITISKNNICTGDTVEFRGPYDIGNSYRWEPSQYFGASHSDVDSGVIDFTRYVTLYVTNRFNCTASDSVLIEAKPCCNIFFPNAFTPNNDGKNDLFRAITVGTHQITAFRVQNRWGQVVFNSGDEFNGWDGTFNGKPQDMGTYFYYIKYKCSDGNFYEDKGEVMLVR